MEKLTALCSHYIKSFEFSNNSDIVLRKLPNDILKLSLEDSDIKFYKESFISLKQTTGYSVVYKIITDLYFGTWFYSYDTYAQYAIFLCILGKN